MPASSPENIIFHYEKNNSVNQKQKILPSLCDASKHLSVKVSTFHLNTSL